jgi:putative polymerase
MDLEREKERLWLKGRLPTPATDQLVPSATSIPVTSIPAAGAALTDTRERNLVVAILVAAVTYQAVLCLINTQIFAASRALVGLAEAAILLACLPLLARRLLPGVLIIALLAGAMLCLLALFSGSLNIKAFRDLIIPLCFFWLGCNIGRPEVGDLALKVIITIVLALGLTEYFFLDAYTSYFDIFGYYVNVGSLQPITEYARDSRLQMNGIRPEGIGRTLLPNLLGSHRVSSVFLEPVSLGNFAAMTAAWGLSRGREELGKGAYFFGAAVVLMVLSDSRFALMSVSIMVAMRLLLTGNIVNLAVLAPFAAIGLLVFLGMTVSGSLADNFIGRLTLSGWSLVDFDAATLLGASFGANYADQGYAYVFSSFGLPLCVLLWFTLWLLPMPDRRSMRFRAFIAIYISLILCVSGTSLFAFKTAGILWFLMGTLLRSPAAAAKRGALTGPAATVPTPQTAGGHHGH